MEDSGSGGLVGSNGTGRRRRAVPGIAGKGGDLDPHRRLRRFPVAIPNEDQIRQCEHQLRQAMLASDVEALEALLDDDLVFTSHLGQVLGKSDDLAAHRSGAVRIHDLELSDERIRLLPRAAVVSVQARIAGEFGGEPGVGVFRFLRIWAPGQDDIWRVVAAQSTLVGAD